LTIGANEKSGLLTVTAASAINPSVAGAAAVTGYVWRFRNGEKVTELKTAAPQVAVTLDAPGEHTVTCEVAGERGLLASQQVKVQVVADQVQINAGGPYSAMRNKPVRLLGNARSRFGKIERYEWYLTGAQKPDVSSAENVIAQHVYAASGQHKAVFAVRLADGTVASDTAVVNVGALLPTAKAGADIISSPGRKVKLEGAGESPDSRIAKYEWDFDGDGAYDWSSETSGSVERPFADFAHAVLRVTDAEGKTATDTVRVVICPKDMETVAGGKFCVDKYEWPNRRGEAPLANVTWLEASKACAGAGKRLCSANEWSRACRNDSGLKPADGRRSYPYGAGFDERRCNTLGNPKTGNAAGAAGTFNCAGALGVHDMSGNVAEWTASPDPAKAQAHGGFFQSGEEESDCDSHLTLDKNRKYPYVGFRCCK
jgi:hypothetical protein